MADEAAPANRMDAFRQYRSRMNERIGEFDHLSVKRFFRLDSAAYEQGALDSKTIDYHLEECVAAVWSDGDLFDVLNVALVVGGSIVIPHLRHAVETIDILRAERSIDG